MASAELAHEHIQRHRVDDAGDHHAADQQTENEVIILCGMTGDGVAREAAGHDRNSESPGCDDGGIQHGSADFGLMPCVNEILPVKIRHKEIALIEHAAGSVQRKDDKNIKRNEAGETDEQDQHCPQELEPFVFFHDLTLSAG